MKSSTLCLLLAACLPLAAQTSPSSPAISRITAPIDEASRVPLKGNVHPLAQARFDRGPAPLATPTGRISLVLQRSAAQQQALTQYLADIQNPGSPSFHKWLTPAQYGATYGISDSDLETVESWLQSHGFKIERVLQARNLIQFSGTFDQVQSAFQTSIHTFSIQGKTHFANVSDPEIPAALAPVVAGLSPLNDFHPEPNVKFGATGRYDTSTHTIKPELTLFGSDNTPYLFVDPADAATIYDAPNSTLNTAYKGTTYDGTGVKIGIAGVSNIPSQDVTNYRGFLGSAGSASNVPTVVVDGNDPGQTGDTAEIEALLDNEVSGALAPKASIFFYTSADTDLSSGLFNSILRALDDNTVSILNISFGACEAAEGTGGNEFILEADEQAAAQGISVTVSTGDSGSAGCDNENTEFVATNGLGVNAFASSPYTIAVGGTDYDILSTAFATYVNDNTDGTAPLYLTALKYIPEEPWNNSTSVNTTISANVAVTDSNGNTNIVAAGGGSSAFYSKPAFQTSLTPADKARDLPDVSFLAGDGQYGALWLVCGDTFADGGSSTLTAYDCATTNGQLTDNSTFFGVGGTSAAAPAFAGMLALVAQAHGSASDNYRLGQADYVLYQLAGSKYSTVFHDVTTGNNSVPCQSASPNCGTNGFLTGYNAGAKYDLASGLGSVDVAQMVSNWTSASLTGTTTTLKLNNSTAAYTGTHGASVAFDVGVTPAAATGVIAVIDTANETSGGTAGGPQNNGQLAIPISSGSGSVNYNGLPGGTYTVTARYGGDFSDAASTSSPAINVTISPENSTTALGVNAYNPLTSSGLSGTSFSYGSQINLDAAISGTSSDETTNGTEGVATGTVTFLNGTTTLGTGSVSSGGVNNSSVNGGLPVNLASWPPLSSKFTVLSPGSYSITARYSGDPSFHASTSAATTFTVAKASITEAASASPTSIASTASSTVTVTLTTPYNLGAAGYGASPTGTVTLTAGGKTVGTITSFTTSLQDVSPYNFVSTGTATVQGSALASGSNTITAAYTGDANYAGSTGTVSVTVTGSSTNPSLSLTSSGNITVSPGATTGNTSTITVTPGGGFTGAVNLTCAVTTALTNPNDLPTCTVTSSVTISGTTAQTATLTVATTASSSGALDLPLKKFFLGGGGAALAMILFFGIPARRRAWRTLFSLLAVIVVGTAVGCGGGGGGGGGGGNSGTTAGAYTVTVTAADAATGKVTNTTTVTVTVN